MIQLNLRYYVYVSTGVAMLVLLLVDPELRARIGDMFATVAGLARELVAALP